MISLTELRHDLYQKIDTLIDTGIPIELKRKGHLVKIIVVKQPSKLARLPKRADFIIDEPEGIIHHDWLKDWHDNLS